jgi:ABC-type Fe3+/spermidine/putrescine transport system ATPase subunit
MRNGEIVQIGTTGDVYDHPATLWVSDFVGGSSHIGGRITSMSESFGFETDVAPIQALWASPGLGVGDRAIAVVRPEHIGVATSPEGATAANTVTVRVEEILNMGSQAKIVARTPGGTEFMASVIRTRLDSAVRPGADVTMFFKPLAVRLYATEADAADHQEPEVGAQ